jgi:hypothetical protein
MAQAHSEHDATTLRRREAQLDALGEALADERMLLDSLVHEARRATMAADDPDPAARDARAEQQALLAQRERWLDARTAELERERRRLGAAWAQLKKPAGQPGKTGGTAGGRNALVAAA